jgi:predicted acylesterase/phospholipase RssA
MDNTTEKDSKIKHLVISGGGPAGFLTYGALRYTAQQKIWNLNELKSIYGCSVGAFFGVIVSLGYDWEWLDDYFIKRPWEKLINISALTFFEKKGLLDEKFIEESIASLLSAKDLNVNITLKELYHHNKIEIHMYTTNINTSIIEKVDLSYKTHPELSVIKALNMSMCYPFLFKPVCINENECYIDGGLLNNYPLNDCIKQQEIVDDVNEDIKDEILAFKNVWVEDEKNKYNITEESSVVDFLLVLMRKMHCSIDTERHQTEIKNTVKCYIEGLDGLPQWLEALSNEEMRKSLIEKGAEQAQLNFKLN